MSDAFIVRKTPTARVAPVMNPPATALVELKTRESAGDYMDQTDPSPLQTIKGDTQAIQFSKYLPHAYYDVQQQIDTGRDVVRRVRKFSEKFSALHSEFAKSVQALVDHERNKFEASKQNDRMEGCWKLWCKVLDFVEILGASHGGVAADVDSMISNVLDHFESIGGSLAKQIYTEQETLSKDLEVLKTSIEKQRTKCTKAIRAAAGNEEELSSAGDEKNDKLTVKTDDKKTKRTSLLKFLEKRKSSRALNNDHKKWLKLQDMCETYNESIVTSNQMLRS
jgi:hypothetical protein